MPQSHIEAHIDLITQHEQEFLAQRTRSERIGDQIAVFVGSFGFVGVQFVLFVAWIAWNVAPGRQQFDPSPFSLLGTSNCRPGHFRKLDARRFSKTRRAEAVPNVLVGLRPGKAFGRETLL